MKAKRVRRSASRLLAQGTIAAVILLGVGATAAWAAWSAIATVPGGTITAGTLKLDFYDAVHVTNDTKKRFSKTISPPVTDLTPGESVAFSITPMNSGDADFTYTVTGSSAPAGLSVRILTGSPDNQTTNSSHTGTCDEGTELPAGGLRIDARQVGSLCVIVEVPAETGPEKAGTTYDILFDFVATQVMQ